jgi:HAD superfamily hydrolase (TIGR01509 family)
MIRAVFFDMDGVLIDAKEWHYEALNKALDLFGMPIDRQAHLSTFDGLPTRRKLAMLGQTQGLPVGLHKLLNDLKQEYTMELIYGACKPTFHHQFALSRLKNDGYSIAVCSNSVRATLETMMRLAALDVYIDLLVSNEDVSAPKPDPEMYNTAIARLKHKPEECLILEDNEHGLQAAQASGAHVLAVNSVADVTIERITAAIERINGAAA